jgi:hypothetical protein
MDVRDDYRGRVLPALDRIRAAAPPLLVVADQAIAMELAIAMATHPFVLARDGPDLDAIGTAAADAGLHRLVFIGNADLRVDVVRVLRSRSGLAYARVSFQEVVGDYAFHEIELVGANGR